MAQSPRASTSLVRSPNSELHVLKCYLADEEVDHWRNEIAARELLRGITTVPELVSTGHCARGHAFLLSKHIDAMEFGQWLAANRPGEGDVVRLLEAVSSALAQLHARGVVHCDIKPSNVLVTRSGLPRVIDFGAARILPSVEASHEGTRAFIAPELLSFAETTPAADVYSLGALTQYALVGVLPEPSTTYHELRSRNAVRQLPPELDRFLIRALSLDPSDRPTATEAAEALRQAAEGSARRTGRSGVRDDALVISVGAREYAFPPGQVVTVGRGAHADVRVDSPYVSRIAAFVELTRDGVVIGDASSANGVSLWSRGQAVPLRPGSSFTTREREIGLGLQGPNSPDVWVRVEGTVGLTSDEEGARAEPVTAPVRFEMSDAELCVVTAYAEPMLRDPSRGSATHAEAGQRLGKSMYSVRNQMQATIGRFRQNLPPASRPHFDRDDFCRTLISNGQVTLEDLDRLPIRGPV